MNAKWLRSNSNIETEFLIPPRTGGLKSKIKTHGFEYHISKMGKIYPPKYISKNIAATMCSPKYINRIRKIIDNSRIDIVHVNGSFNIVPAIAGKLGKSQVVWHFNGYNLPETLLHLSKFISNNIADEFIFSSSVIKKEVFSDNKSGKIIWPPVNIDEFYPKGDYNSNSLRDTLNIDDSIPIVGTVANINPAKDIGNLLTAIKKTVDSWGEIAVPIVGRPSDTQSEYMKTILNLRDKLDINDNVSFLGWMENIPAILSQFDIFVLSSKIETGPMTLIEAMAMELPIITTRVGIVEDVQCIDEFSWIVPPESPNELSQAILSALSSQSLWSEYGEKARDCAVAKFSLGASGKKHESVYQSL